ncbi:MAG: Folylpolyglutamate synthase [Syntrophomonadaceae bacterium]|nr:Folylpolyglutamate synthase [Bacillota bacterium]
MNYQEALAWIHSLYRFGSKPGLERIADLLKRLGDPHQLLRSAHITGTNGKGSTAAFLAALLSAHGLRVGLYTSPYLESFTNRMAVDGRDVAEDELVDLVKKVRPHVAEIADSAFGQPTEFEVITAMAFDYFAACLPDWVVVEVGLGGRLDATNVIMPEVAVITNIGLEHTQVLGDTVEQIAFEKAGIIKQGVPVVTAADKPEALAVLEKTARKRGSRLLAVGREVQIESAGTTLDGQIFNYQSPWRELKGLSIGLLGRHQLVNAASALAALECLPSVPISEAAVRRGLAAARWPGRLEIYSRNPLVLVDGAHNVDGALALRRALTELLDGRKLYLVLGILADKAVEEMLSLLAPLATAGLLATRPDNVRAADPYVVAELARAYTRATVQVTPNVPAALEAALSAAKPEEAVCVAGSLYTVSEACAVLRKVFDKSRPLF